MTLRTSPIAGSSASSAPAAISASMDVSISSGESNLGPALASLTTDSGAPGPGAVLRLHPHLNACGWHAGQPEHPLAQDFDPRGVRGQRRPGLELATPFVLATAAGEIRRS